MEFKITKEKRETMFRYLMAVCKLDESFIDWLNEQNFFTAPASTKYHGSHDGGLFFHSFEVAKSLVDITMNMNLKWEKQRSPYLIGMFHDLVKTQLYEGEEGSYTYRKDAPKGHGDISVQLLMSWIPDLTKEERACIYYHMGAFTEKEEWENYGKAIETYPNVLWTHTADMVASRIIGI